MYRFGLPGVEFYPGNPLVLIAGPCVIESEEHCLFMAAVAVGINALFLEVHENPDQAKCDGPNMVTPEELQGMLPTLLEIDRILKTTSRQQSPGATD